MLGPALSPVLVGSRSIWSLRRAITPFLLSLLLISSLAESKVGAATTRLWTQRTGVGFTNENTVEGLEHALSLGAVGAEFDIWQSASSPAYPDGEIVLSHDRFVDDHTDYTELTGLTNGDISQLTFEEIRALNAGANPAMHPPLQGTAAYFSPIKIPTLEEILLSFKANNADALFHFKAYVGEELRTGAVDPADVAAVLQQTDFPLDKRYVWTNVDSSVQSFVAEIPGIRVIYQGFVDPANPDWDALHDLGIKALQVSSGQLSQGFIDAIHAEGLEAFMFTPSRSDFIDAVRYGVDIVMTHRITEFLPYLDSLDSIEQGDFDGDGLVGGADFLAWQRGETLAPLTSADISLNASDLLNWEANFGSPATGLESTAVPEPSTLAMLIAMLLIGWCVRKRQPCLTR